MKRDGLTKTNFWAYSAGHFGNDLQVCMWFIYFPFYARDVIKLNKDIVGLCVLIAQIVDGVMTVIIGMASDKYNTRFGKRMPWFVIGTLISFPSMFLMFSYPDFYADLSPKHLEIVFLVLNIVWTIAWPAVQISHMAIVNTLSSSNRMRDKMVNYRNGFTFLANITTVMFAYLFFMVIDDKKEQYRYTIIICSVLGIITSAFFIFNINEPKLSALAKQYGEAYEAAKQREQKNIT